MSIQVALHSIDAAHWGMIISHDFGDYSPVRIRPLGLRSENRILLGHHKTEPRWYLWANTTAAGNDRLERADDGGGSISRPFRSFNPTVTVVPFTGQAVSSDTPTPTVLVTPLVMPFGSLPTADTHITLRLSRNDLRLSPLRPTQNRAVAITLFARVRLILQHFGPGDVVEWHQSVLCDDRVKNEWSIHHAGAIEPYFYQVWLANGPALMTADHFFTWLLQLFPAFQPLLGYRYRLDIKWSDR